MGINEIRPDVIARGKNSAFEAERYELTEAPRHHFELQRREFFRVMGAGAVVLVASRGLLAQGRGGAGAAGGAALPAEMSEEVNAYIHIGENGMVTAFSGKVEIGQNNRTMFTQLVAEELHVPVARVNVITGDTGRTPWDRGTVGSESAPVLGKQFRRAGAAAREMIVARAAQMWNVQASRLTVKDGRVSETGGARAATYAELLKGQELAEIIPKEVEPTPPSQWTIAGTEVPKVGGRDFVTGKHTYLSDMKLPGMVHGKMIRPPSYGATIETVDAAAAQAMPGVTVVRDGEFLGVTAPTLAAAERAARAVKVTWKEKSGQPSNAEIFEYLKKNSRLNGATEGDRGTPDMDVWNQGSVEQGLAAAAHKLSQTYTIRYVAHCPLETRAGLAQWDGDKVTVWTGVQRLFGARGEISRAMRVPEANVRVITPENSPCYGGKHNADAGVEAARLARGAGKPVKLVWTREEEFNWAYFRPGGTVEIQSGMTADGKLTAWEFHNYNSGPGALGSPYKIPNKKHQYHMSTSPLRQGSYRGLAATFNHFARETHMDELSYIAKVEPLAFRRMNTDEARLLAVYDAAAKQFGWGRAKTEQGQGFGIAGGMEKLGYVATCAEVRVNPEGQARVARVVVAFECGAIINPNQLRNQMEGAQMFGLGGALFEEIEFENGKLQNGSFSDYRLPRFSDMPVIETVLLNRPDIEPGGAGEVPMFGLAPAIGNAIFDATGVRVRSMPLARDGVDLKNTQSRASA
jgi:CO/xanthine dehydrogenase Mo-binding subunit